MKVVLLHKPGAGNGAWPKGRILDTIENAGLDCIYEELTEGTFDRQETWDRDATFVIAGGDGSVARTLTSLHDRSRPVAILPIGGANNLARSLGAFGEVDAILADLEFADRRPFWLLCGAGGCGTLRIVESFGLGQLTEAMAGDDDVPPAEKRAAGRRRARRAIAEAAPLDLTIHLDGRPLPEAPLFVEALNAPMIGPHLRLAPSPRQSGSAFDVVWLSESDRGAFLDWLSDGGDDDPAPVSRRSVQHFAAIGFEEARVDDRAVRCDGREVVIESDPAPFQLLIPAQGA